VPHTLMSGHGSPGPLLKFQMNEEGRHVNIYQNINFCLLYYVMVFTHIKSVVLYVYIYSLVSMIIRDWPDACCVLLMLLNT
jgi:hypothetical protein